ncbi:radial spoke head protein 3 homolog B-like [Cololabis saira]|uniref:radial spoke head protein 3 homolog B-like n=1 Tax=Cololabis saira TaxID=129043 RepID=UPI002AD32F56|nr:radial spoke head protein 3 homolog B-like [Cololabis saira]
MLYTFSSRPRPVKTKEPPDERTQHFGGNIMYDRHVVRGSTYPQGIIPAMAQTDIVGTQRRPLFRRRAITHKQHMGLLRTTTPEAVHGRKHIDVQTESYLEELAKVPGSSEAESQTEAFLDKPATPLFIPDKSGIDVTTQIKEGELFDFDREMQPVVEVLVGKTIEQSQLEVMEEEELASLRAQQMAFEELRVCELRTVQRLQEQDRRINEEKERRIAQQKEVLKKEKEVVYKISARVYARQCLANLLPMTLNSVRDQGYLFDPVQKDIETHFFPWLMAEVDSCLERRYCARELLDTMILEVSQKRLEQIQELETQLQESDS